MKQKLIRMFSRAVMTLLVTMLTAVTAGAWSGSGTTADPYIISSSADWTTFCNLLTNETKGYFSGKTVKLGANIEVGSMAGSSNHDFTGTFDGAGHTLTFNYNASTNNAAPFQFVETGCLIKNLHVAGTIVTSAKFAAGLIAQQYGTVTIRNCRSSVIIRSSKGGDDSDGTHGGLVAVNNNATNSNLTIENCLFDGKLLTTNGTTKCGGFVGYKGKNLTIKNSLYAPATLEQGETEITDNSPTFARNWTPGANDTGLYYTRTLGAAQGTDATGMTSDELAEALGTAWYVSDGKVLPYMGQNYYVYFDTSARKYRSALVPDGATVVTAIDNYITWGTANTVTWYVIQGDVSGHRIAFKGTANLVLCDGAKLTVDRGLLLNNDIIALNIYAQSDGAGMGEIEARGYNDNNPAIGAETYKNLSTCSINIHGGKITATGAQNTAGIGGAYQSNTGTINIYGGDITATGGQDAAGIGAGKNGSFSAINIYGGRVKATGGSVGIGKSGSSSPVFLSWTDADNDWIESSSYGGTVTIDAEHPFKLSSTGADATTSNIGGQKIVPAEATVYTVTFDTDGGTAVASQSVIKGQTATQPGNPVKKGYRLAKWQLSGADYDFSTAVTADITLTAVWTALPDITYQNASDVTTTLAGTDYSPLEPSVTTLDGGTWVVVDDATTFADRITVKGSVTLILTDGKRLTAQSGISVTEADNAALTIYAQNGGTGTLVAQQLESNSYYACIGGTNTTVSSRNCGTIDIYGGRIQTSGNCYGAGIGGGYAGNGGTIRIHGGQIDVGGGQYNHAIGYGRGATGDKATATISLGWTRETDYIRTHTSDYGSAAQYYGTVTLASIFLLDGTGTKASWTSESDNNIDGKKLIPKTQMVWADVQDGLNAGQTVTLTNDVSSESGQTTLVVPNGVTTAIDLNGHTLRHQYATDKGEKNYVIVIKTNATLTISDGSTNGGGTITGNMGGIHSNGAVTLSGITISGCGGNNQDAIINNGGALSMTDCTVTGNTGGGVYVSSGGTLTLSGKVNITGNTREIYGATTRNVYLNEGTVITLGGALDSDSRIGVYTGGNAIITSDAKGKAVLANFTNDKTDYYICWTTDGTEIQLSKTYAMSENDGVADLESRYAGQSVPVSFTRTFTDGVASTICLPFRMNASQYDDNGTFYSFVGVEKGTNEWTVTMKEVNNLTSNILSAGTPYLFLPKQTGTVTFTPHLTGNEDFTVPAGGFSTVDVTPNTNDYPDAAGWTFKGTFTGEQWAEAPQTPTYGFSAQAVAADGISRGEFVRVGAKVRIRPFRAYMQYEEPAGARGMNRAAADAADLPDVLTVRLIGADGELTGIGQMDSRTGQVTFDAEAWYTMDGVRLPSKPTANGIYINNGKKVVIK